MEGACRGAKSAGGTTIGILPGAKANDANGYVDIPIVTGLSLARNLIVVRSSQALIAIEGGYGTLSEIAFSLHLGVPVIGLKASHHDRQMIKADSPEDAVEQALSAIARLSGQGFSGGSPAQRPTA
jgi:uncharacterized protein (TIGR00725 family)